MGVQIEKRNNGGHEIREKNICISCSDIPEFAEDWERANSGAKHSKYRRTGLIVDFFQISFINNIWLLRCLRNQYWTF